MSNYENAPATILLATTCCICNRPLVDAISVDLGMGPDCRRKYFKKGTPETEANRPAANKIVHMLACATGPQGISDRSMVPAALVELSAMGFTGLVEKLGKVLTAVTIGSNDQTQLYTLNFPYNEKVIDNIRLIPGRRWNPEAKAWTVPMNSKIALHKFLQRCFPGCMALGSKGYFIVGSAA